ncbi:hypothetical protein GPECTOR_31g293 [Gonium pectorale]|uniref:cellulase n=1 Tax=Gonium pectorale TaxID=33097 RepID=A0A150GDJ9_GONPE|nr:hypothetical protein GPECTOR_31g293 [Gonium pectorale]|eukprot:KXZ47931.1 hypothetical protein GPECTOR_31g293 [Gonium pectorale]
MSGDLPSWSYARNWRDSSFSSEGAISKGFFTDGGHLKSSLTMASSASLLAFSALTWKDSLVSSGNWDGVVRNVRWAADHLMACAANDGEFVAQAVAALTGAGLLLRLPGEHQDEDASEEFLDRAQALWDEWASTLESV